MDAHAPKFFQVPEFDAVEGGEDLCQARDIQRMSQFALGEAVLCKRGHVASIASLLW
jgi:hypothetical protein